MNQTIGKAMIAIRSALVFVPLLSAFRSVIWSVLSPVYTRIDP